MQNDKPLVTNASDYEQIKNAKKKEKITRENELDDIRVVLSSPEGKRFLWRILAKCKTFESIFEQSAKIHYNAGQQDVGHFLMSEIIEADEEILFRMMNENLKKVDC